MCMKLMESARIGELPKGKVGPLAQLVEQRTFNPWVDGSSPSGPTFSKLGKPMLATRIFKSNLVLFIQFGVIRLADQLAGSVPTFFDSDDLWD